MSDLNRIEDKIDKVIESIASIDKSLAVHIQKAADSNHRIKGLEDIVGPLKDQVTRWKAVWAFALGLPSIAAALHWILR